MISDMLTISNLLYFDGINYLSRVIQVFTCCKKISCTNLELICN